MARKKTKKRKSKKKSTPREKKRTDLEILKEHQSKLFTKVQENLEIILRQTGIEKSELAKIIQKYGYDAIPTLEGFEISEPIWNRMVKTFQRYDKIAISVERYETLQNKLEEKEIDDKIQKMAEKVAEFEEEEQYYTEKELDKDGITKMKQKFYIEKEHWELKKAEAQDVLGKDPENRQAQTQLAQAELQLKLLSKKRWNTRFRNIQPEIGKRSRQIGKIINTIQDSATEITKPFQEMSKMSGYDQTEKKQNNDWGFSPEGVFGTGSEETKDKKKKYSFTSGF